MSMLEQMVLKGYTDFSGMNFQNETFSNLDLIHKKLNFEGCTFYNVTFNYFNVSNSNFKNCKFNDVTLNYSRFNSVDFTGSQFNDITLNYCDFKNCTSLNSCRISDVSENGTSGFPVSASVSDRQKQYVSDEYVTQSGNFGIGRMSGGTIIGAKVSSAGIENDRTFYLDNVPVKVDFSDLREIKVSIDGKDFSFSRQIKNQLVLEYIGISVAVFGVRLFLRGKMGGEIDIIIKNN
jgi:uncharacterized protein YjbI with pentapeptide repeats